MRSLTATLIAIGLCFAATGASADYFDSDQLAKIEAVEVQVEASIDDVCLGNSDVLKNEAELVLRRSGIKVVEDNASHYVTIHVSGIGKFACAAVLGLKVCDFQTQTDGLIGLVLAVDSGGFRLGAMPDFPQQLQRDTIAAPPRGEGQFWSPETHMSKPLWACRSHCGHVEATVTMSKLL